MKVRTTILAALLAAISSVAAHEGHSTEPGKPNFVDVERNGVRHRVGVAWVPPEPLVGENVHLEVQFVTLAPPLEPGQPPRAQPLAGAPVRLRITAADHSTTTSRELGPTGADGISRGSLDFNRAGAYVLTVTAESKAGGIPATYTVAVGAGPLRSTTVALDGLVVLLFLGIGFTMWRAAQPDRRAAITRVAAVALFGVAALAAAHLVLGPAAGRLLLPERPEVTVAWDSAPASGLVAEASPGSEGGSPDRTISEASPDPGSSALLGADVSATVVPAPGAVADVVVPVAARVMLRDGVRLGATVKAGQPLATLEHHYVLHDAVHLINTRWPLLTEFMRTRRDMLAADLMALRMRGLEQKGTIPSWAVQLAQGTVSEARVEYARAQKLLSMHDAQIRKSNLVQRPLEAPISGTIESVTLVQGQLAYENDPLFTIVDLSNLWVELRIPERQSARWRPAKRLTFVSAALPGTEVEGSLARVSNQVDPASRTLAYFYRVSNPGKLLRVGMRLRPVLEDRATAARQDDLERAAFEPTTGSNETSAPRPPARLSVTGIVRPKPELIAQATAPIWGRIEFKDRPLNVGDPVKKDTVLANVILELSIDERYLMEARAEEIVAELRLAKVRLAQCEQQHQDAIERLKAAPDDVLLKEEVKMTEAALRAARQDASLLEQQNASYDRTMKIRDPRITPVPAPISGVITELAFRPGELNATGEFRRLFTIVDTSRVWIEAQVFEQQGVSMLQRLKRASFQPADGGPAITLGRPVAVSATVDPKTRTLRVIFEAGNPDARLKLGGSGQVALEWN